MSTTMYNQQYYNADQEEREDGIVTAAPPAGYYAAWPQQASYVQAQQDPGPSFPVYAPDQAGSVHLAQPTTAYQNYGHYSLAYPTVPAGSGPIVQPSAQYYSPTSPTYPSQQGAWTGQQLAPPSQMYFKEEGSEGGSATSYRSSSDDGTHDGKGKSAPISPTNQFFTHAPPENWQTRGNSTILHMYKPPTTGSTQKSNALVAVFNQDPDGTAKLRAPNTACYHCKHRRIKCEDKIYTKSGRPFCSACVQRQGPCYWPPRYHPYLQADYLTARRAQLLAEDPETYHALANSGQLDDHLLADFDPTKCPKPLSWSWGYNEVTGRKEFDDMPPTGREKTPKRRKTLDDYWWDRW